MDAISPKPLTARGCCPQDRFVELLPRIRRQAWLAFRALDPELRDELVTEVVANAYCAYQRLADQGREELAYATPLAQFAIRQVRVGRRVGARMNRDDVLSQYARTMRPLKIERLDQAGPQRGTWKEVLLEDRRAGPAATAAARIDVTAWFQSLPPAQRRLAGALARGERTRDVARRFQLTPGRISQLRAWFEQHWEQFHAPAVDAKARPVVRAA